MNIDEASHWVGSSKHYHYDFTGTFYLVYYQSDSVNTLTEVRNLLYTTGTGCNDVNIPNIWEYDICPRNNLRPAANTYQTTVRGVMHNC